MRAGRWIAAMVVSLPLFTACGGGGSAVPGSTIRNAAEATLATGSAAFEQHVSFEGSDQIPDSTRFGSSGTSTFGDLDEKQMHLIVEVPGMVGSIEVVVSGSSAYLRGAPFAELTGTPDTWLSLDLESSGELVNELEGLTSGRNDAALLLYYLFGGDDEAEIIGHDSIDGVEVTGYATSLSLGLAVEETPYGARDAMRTNLSEIMAQDTSTTLGAEVWIDGDGLIRRMVYVYDVGREAGGGEMRLVSELSEFGEHATVEAPPSGEIVTLGGSA